MSDQAPKIDAQDVKVLRQLAMRVREIAGEDENLARKQRWLRHNARQTGAPMVLAELGGLRANGELPVEPQLQCRENWARDMERGYRCAIYQFAEIKDDWVVEPFNNIGWKLNVSGFGVEAKRHSGTQGEHMGSFVWEPPLKNLREDFAKLTPRTFAVNREGTLAWKNQLDNLLGDILPTRIRSSYWWTRGMTIVAIDLIGLEQLMLYMMDDPEGLHRLMQFLHDDHLAFSQWLEQENLLSLNNENDYIGSGSVAYSAELPQKDFAGQVRLKDLWCLLESQETVGVGPEMFAEFIHPYQKSLARHFGLTYYGCCEPIHSRWHVIRDLPQLRKLSISPWCDETFMARELGDQYIYCRKPNPALVSTPVFDEVAIRADLAKTIQATRAAGCVVELVMKDVHTVQNQPQRLARWVQLAREATC